jgi:hypothetical protein
MDKVGFKPTATLVANEALYQVELLAPLCAFRRYREIPRFGRAARTLLVFSAFATSEAFSVTHRRTIRIGTTPI